jgi:hypothetical protein
VKKNIILAITLLILGIQNMYPNNYIEISLLTCSSGQDTYESWGHSAIRVVDYDNSSDITYNFGCFDFDTQNFYLKFIQGKLKYHLGIQNTATFIDDYIMEGRQVFEQKLNLSDDCEKRIIDKLKYLYKPENRYYYYKFVDNNCTTALRDLILSNVNTDFNNKLINKTSRILISEYLSEQLWTRLGMNLILGSQVDRRIDIYKSMFLPDYLSSELSKVKENGKNLVINERTHNLTKKNTTNYPFLLNPSFVLSVLALFVLLYKSSKFQGIIFILVGIIGILLFSITIFAQHLELKNNFNLFWCNPLYFISAIFLFAKTKVKLQMYLSILLMTSTIGMIVIWIWNIQSFENGFLPIVIILSIYNFRIIKTGYNSV